VRKILPFLLILLLIVGCRAPEKEEKPVVVASIYPYELLLREILGPDFEVKTLIPPNASPHSYSPRPKELAELHEAAFALSNGYGLETGLDQAFDALGEKHLKVSELLGEEAAGAQGNPHVWLSPILMQKLVLELYPKLQELFPEHHDVIANNAVNLGATLTALDSRIETERERMEKTPLITFHDSFHHFTKLYEIDDLGSVQSSAGHEPSPGDLARLGALIKENSVTAVCVEPQMDKKSAQVLASEFDLDVVELDPLGTSLEVNTLTELIEANWERMRSIWTKAANGK